MPKSEALELGKAYARLREAVTELEEAERNLLLQDPAGAVARTRHLRTARNHVTEAAKVLVQTVRASVAA